MTNRAAFAIFYINSLFFNFSIIANIALDMGIDNHLQFSEDEAGTKAMFARENRARERYNKFRAMDCKMEVGSYFEEK